MVIEQDKWIIEAREGFAVAGDSIDSLTGEDGAAFDVTNFSVRMRITGFGRNEEFSNTNGCFVIVPPIAPATYPTGWSFQLTLQQVAALKNGNNDFEVLIADGNGVLIGEAIYGTINKRK